MANDIESLVQKSALFEKKIALKRSKAAKELSSNLSAVSLDSAKILSHSASESIYRTACNLDVWRQDFREKCDQLFDCEYVEREQVFDRLARAISALNNDAIFVFGNNWDNHGALVISTNLLANKIAELSFLVSDSFTLIDGGCSNALRFEADEVGGRFSVAEAYFTGSNWGRLLKAQLSKAC